MSTVVGRAVERLDEQRRRTQVYWLTVAFFAVVIAYVDGFWLTSMQGAVGAIERNEEPLGRWLRDSTLMVPLFFLGVSAAVLLARRWFGHRRSWVVKVGATALLVTVIGSAIGIAETAASSAYDYRLQSRDLTSVHQFHQTIADAKPGATAPTSGCTGICAEKQLTLASHVKALKLATGLLLVSNLVVVLWVMMFRGDRLWRSARADDEARVVEARSTVEAVLV